MFPEKLKRDLQKRKNSKLIPILEAIWLQKATNRRDIGEVLTLSKGTMTKRVAYLIENGYVVENGSDVNTGMGRNPENLKLPKDLFYSIGLHISPGNIYVVALDANNKIILTDSASIQHDCKGMQRLEFICGFIHDFIQKLGLDEEKMIGLGITLPGINDWDKGIVYSSSGVPELNDFPLKKYISEEFNCDCEMINISHLSAINEKKWGKASKLENFITLDQGLGIGIYMNGQLYRGWQGYAGEFGFMQVKETGDIGIDGRKGLIGSNAAIYRAEHAIKNMYKTGQLQNIEKYCFPESSEISSDMIVKAVCDGDKFCRAIFRENFEWIAKGMLNLAYILNPQVIFLPSWTAGCPDFTIEVVKSELAHYGAANWHLKIKVDSARCGNSFYPSGAAYYLVERMFENIKNQ